MLKVFTVICVDCWWWTIERAVWLKTAQSYESYREWTCQQWQKLDASYFMLLPLNLWSSSSLVQVKINMTTAELDISYTQFFFFFNLKIILRSESSKFVLIQLCHTAQILRQPTGSYSKIPGGWPSAGNSQLHCALNCGSTASSWGMHFLWYRKWEVKGSCPFRC